MKLKSLQIFPSGSSGWKSDILTFGDNITQLYGSNGCGKTPLVQSIVFCLGYPSIFRNDIYDHCDYVILNVEIDSGPLIIKRVFSRDVDIEVTDSCGNIQRFFSEKDYSLFVFDWMNIESNNLVTISNKIGQPYLSSMIPIFYLDQDDGYSKVYSPPSNFIKDQFSEMMRMIFKLPVKNSFDAKKARIKSKEELEYLDNIVEINARKVVLAKQNIASTTKNAEDITADIQFLEVQLDQLKSSGASHDDSVNVLDQLIYTHESNIRNLIVEINKISKRCNSIHQIIHEINSEIDTLNLNEEARRVFLSFNEICGSSQCQLFSSSSDSYAKNLLYLKDQIKDLERNATLDEVKKEQLALQKSKIELDIKNLVEKRSSILEKSEISALVDAISEIKDKIFDLQSLLSDIKKIELLEDRQFEGLTSRENALAKYQSFSTDRSSIPELICLRADLRKYFLNWLEILNTNNISRDITFKNDFTPILGNETISQLKGSTRTRAVLSYHAASIELASRKQISSFQFFIMDTPKQHEIQQNDLDSYIKALKIFSATSGIQIIFSTTEYHYVGDKSDKEWNPEYDGEKQKMFLKKMS